MALHQRANLAFEDEKQALQEAAATLEETAFAIAGSVSSAEVAELILLAAQIQQFTDRLDRKTREGTALRAVSSVE